MFEDTYLHLIFPGTQKSRRKTQTQWTMIFNIELPSEKVTSTTFFIIFRGPLMETLIFIFLADFNDLLLLLAKHSQTNREQDQEWEKNVALPDVPMEYVGISMESVGIWMEYVGISMESVGIWIEYVGISMEYVGILMEHAGISMESVGVWMGYVGISMESVGIWMEYVGISMD